MPVSVGPQWRRREEVQQPRSIITDDIVHDHSIDADRNAKQIGIDKPRHFAHNEKDDRENEKGHEASQNVWFPAT